jgi:hypothetical protein
MFSIQNQADLLRSIIEEGMILSKAPGDQYSLCWQSPSGKLF